LGVDPRLDLRPQVARRLDRRRQLAQRAHLAFVSIAGAAHVSPPPDSVSRARVCAPGATGPCTCPPPPPASGPPPPPSNPTTRAASQSTRVSSACACVICFLERQPAPPV